MGSYGPYETNREIGSGYGSTVYSARKTGEGADSYAVKVYSIDSLVGDNPENRAALDPLLHDLDRTLTSRIELQKKAAESSRYVAPILESGQEGQEVWYATRLYPRSLQKIIAGHVSLSQEILCHILRSMVRGVLDLQQAGGRSHGNLKPSNVLISGAAKMLEAEVMLSDPLPGGVEEATRYERADLRALGEILLQLVRRRELTEGSNWLILPIESSAEWTQTFGKDAAAWLALCNRLLDPNPSADSLTLSQLATELAALTPKPPVSKKTLALAAAGVVVAVAVALVVFWPSNQGRVVLTSEPTGAKIYLEGQDKEFGQAPIDRKLPKGEYKFVAKIGELSSPVFQVTVEGGKTYKYPFRFEFSTIVVESEPSGALIRFGTNDLMTADGKQATTPYTHQLFVKAGTKVEYNLNKDLQHETVSIQTNVPLPGQSLRLQRVLPAIQPGMVGVEFNCVSLPNGETITLTDNSLGTFDFRAPSSPRKSMAPGKHTIVAKCRNLPPFGPKEITVQPGQGNRFDLDFDFGLIVLEKSDPADVFYSIDDEKKTNTLGNDEILIPIPLGKPVGITFTKLGYEDAHEVFKIDARNGQKKFSPRLKQVLGWADITIDAPVAARLMIRGANSAYSTNIAPAQPIRILLPPGDYSATATVEGLEDVAKPLRINSGKPFAATFPFAYATLRLKSNLERTDIALLGVRTNAAPFNTYVRPGSYQLIARDPVHGLPDESTTTPDLKANQEFNSTFMFKFGTVIVTSLPPIVELRLPNAAPIGQTPWTNHFARAGEVKYQLFLSNQAQTISAMLAPGSIIRMGADLTRRPSYTNDLKMVFVSWRNDYYVGQWEVSQEQYQTVMGTTIASTNLAMPVTVVPFAQASNFCVNLTAKDREAHRNDPNWPFAGWVYELPTEQEWWGFANPTPEMLENSVFSVNRLEPPQSTGLYARNSQNNLGIYDLFGNVAEWCWGTNYQSIITIGGQSKSKKPSLQVVNTSMMRVSGAYLTANVINNGSETTGFRCVFRPKTAP